MENINLNKIKRKTTIDKIIRIIFLIVTILCSLCVVFIALFICIKGLTPFFKKYEINNNYYRVNIFKFLFGTKWFKSPNVYGAGYIIINTIIVTILSLLISVPISILTALFISRIAPKKLGIVLNSIVELLSGIPSIIYGLFGAGVITNFVDKLGSIFGIQSAGGISLLSTVLVLSIL